MKNLIQAMEEEKLYVSDRMQEINTSLSARLIQYGYEDLNEYFRDKKEYIFEQWKPEVYYVAVSTLTTTLEEAIRNKKYGVYISVHNGLYAFHGADDINYALCEELGVTVAELHHKGGTIIGSTEDLGIWICMPQSLRVSFSDMMNGFHKILSKYIDNIVIDGNDFLVDDQKIMGSMQRTIGDTYIWAAQFSFGEHDEIIQKICNKKSNKKAGKINKKKITKDKFEKEVLKWLRKL